VARAYRMTPKRRAALHKAQLASAKKRRRTRNRRIAVAAGGVGVLAGVGAGAYLGHRYVSALKGGPQPVKAGPVLSSSKELDLVRVRPRETGENWTHVGKPIMRTVLGKKVRKRKFPTYVEHERARVKGEKTRAKKNYKARRKYWRSKPVGGTKRGKK
jgi:hypothetical protein